MRLGERTTKLKELMRPLDIPVGQRGDWVVERFSVSESSARRFNWQSPDRPILPGEYTRLVEGGPWSSTNKSQKIWMSDTPAEMDDMSPLICDQVAGADHVLLNGLGLGASVRVCLEQGCRRVTVIEKSPEVLQLCGKHWVHAFGASRVELIKADALTWRPPAGKKYDFVWHDIWLNISDLNWPEMKKLHRAYGSRSGGNQESWCRGTVKRMASPDYRPPREFPSFLLPGLF